jgi:hypothetical protein
VNDIDGWIYFDGPEPEHIRPLLDALRDLPPSTPEDKQRMARRLFEKLDAELARNGEPPVATAATAATSARASGERRVGQDVATTRSPSFEERPPAPPPAEPPPLPVDAREPRPPQGRPAENLTITAPVLELPAEVRRLMGGLPFKPRAPGMELTRTMQVPVLNPRKGETMPLEDDSITKAVAALPFAGNTVGAAPVSYPRLSLEVYAWLRAELSLWPERSAEILPHYHVMNEAACRALPERSPQFHRGIDKTYIVLQMLADVGR